MCKLKKLRLIVVGIALSLFVCSVVNGQECSACDPLYDKYGGALLVGRVERNREATSEEKERVLFWQRHRRHIKVVVFRIIEKFSEEAKKQYFEIFAEKNAADKLKVGAEYLVYADSWGGKGSPPLGLDAENTKLIEKATEALSYLRRCAAQEKKEDANDNFGCKIFNAPLSGKAVNLPKPSYPDEVKKAKVSGKVILQILIDESGQVIKARAICGHPLLIPPAIEAALKARFTPTVLSGKPRKVCGTIIYNFGSQ